MQLCGRRWQPLRRTQLHSDVLDDHLACPRCGYDLYGIPPDRCPECGYRYDAAGLAATVTSAECERHRATQVILVRSGLASALAMPSMCEFLGITGLALLCVVALAYAAAFWMWVVYIDVYRGIGTLPGLLSLFVIIGLAVRWLMMAGPRLPLAAGCVVLLSAWLARIQDWPRLAGIGAEEEKECDRSVTRSSFLATVVLVGASVVLLGCLCADL